LGLSPLRPSSNTPTKATKCTTNINITSSILNFYKIHNYNSPQRPQLHTKQHNQIIYPKPSNSKTTTADVHPVCSHLHHDIDSEIKQMTRELTGFRNKRKSIPVADSDLDSISFESTNLFQK
jgi:hypothetical protein